MTRSIKSTSVRDAVGVKYFKQGQNIIETVSDKLCGAKEISAGNYASW